jgi:hypothetical protein
LADAAIPRYTAETQALKFNECPSTTGAINSQLFTFISATDGNIFVLGSVNAVWLHQRYCRGFCWKGEMKRAVKCFAHKPPHQHSNRQEIDHQAHETCKSKQISTNMDV